MAVLSSDELRRYHRHILLPELGLAGQRSLKEGSVLIVGAGGLGSPAALYLAAAGVGRIGIVDFDSVDESNLQRQILFDSQQTGTPKAANAHNRLAALNPFSTIEAHRLRLDATNALDLFSKYDLILDASDNFPTRYLVNDACVLTQRPNVHASVLRFEGRLSVFSFEDGPCYRCLYPRPPEKGAIPTCAEAGVLGAVPGVLGSMQAIEAIKILCKMDGVLSGELRIYDALRGRLQTLRFAKDPECPVCGRHPNIRSLKEGQMLCGLDKTEEDKSDATMQEIPEIDVHTLKERLNRGDEFVLLDVREDFEYDICKIEGSRLLPLSILQDHLDELNKEDEFVVMCKVGGRSARAVTFLLEEGFSNVTNLKGGIMAWIDEIDDSLARY